MISAKELSALLATLYAAPLEPEKWQVFLDHLCALTNAASGYMVSVQPEGKNAILAGGGLNFDPEILHLYSEHYGATDPYVAPMMSNPRVGIIQAEELVQHADFVQSELYNDLLRGYDLEHMTVVSSECFTGEGDFFPLWRSPKHGPMDTASIHLLETLIPHVQTALRFRVKVIGHDAVNLFSETTLDAMSIAAFLVTGKGRVRHMNHRAATYLKSGDGLRLQDGRLAATHSYESAQLESLIAGATSIGRNSSEAVPGGAMRISRLRTHSTLQVTILPAPQDNQIADGAPSALVFVSDPSSSTRPRMALMRQLYGLTPVEARVANLLLEGFEVREAAERLSITLETARFHLKRVLSKTGTRRQAELMRLMLSLPGQS